MTTASEIDTSEAVHDSSTDRDIKLPILYRAIIDIECGSVKAPCASTADPAYRTRSLGNGWQLVELRCALRRERNFRLRRLTFHGNNDIQLGSAQTAAGDLYKCIIIDWETIPAVFVHSDLTAAGSYSDTEGGDRFDWRGETVESEILIEALSCACLAAFDGAASARSPRIIIVNQFD